MTTTRHPSLWSIAQHLRDVAQVLDANGRHDRNEAAAGRCRCLPCAAQLLAARGWPASTMSDGTGSRTADSTSSTERAAGLAGNSYGPLTPSVFAGIDERLAKHLHLLWQVGLRVQVDARNVLAHADRDDTLPAGSGECGRCGHFCRPDQNPSDRIRSGYCNTCHRLWLRWGKPERFAFARSGKDENAA